MGYYGSPKGRADVRATGEGLITETFPRASGQGATIMIDGTVYVVSVGLLAGEVVTNLSINVTASGTTMTLSKLGLYSKAGARLTLSADQGTAWQSTGMKTVAMTSAYTVPSSDLYYVAAVAKGATLPTLNRGNNSNALSVAIGTGALPFGAVTGQTDLPDPLTIVAGNGIAYWVGVS